MGFFRLKEKPYLFYNKKHIVYLVVYINNFLLIYPKSYKQTVNKIVKGIKKKYNLTGGNNVNTFLSIRIIKNRKSKKL